MKPMVKLLGIILGMALAGGLSAQPAGRGLEVTGTVPTPEKHALLIGIGYNHLEPGRGRLFGPLNRDLPRVEKLLKNTFGFKAQNLKLLTERDATKQGILDALESHLVQRVKPGDFAVLYYSGHGSRMPSGTPGEPYDELLCPVDFGSKAGMAINPITDKTLKTYLDRIAAKVGPENVLVILDSCHSGTATRSLLEGLAAQGGADQAVVVPRHFPADSYWEMNESRAITGTRAGGDDLAFGGTSEETMKHVLIAGCDRNETSKDNSDFGGFLTYSLCNALEKNPQASYATIMETVSATVAGMMRELNAKAKLPLTPQSPQLEGPLQLKKRPVLTAFKAENPVVAPPPPPPPPPPLVNNQIVSAVGGTPIVPVIPLDGLNQIGPIQLSVELNQREYREGEKLTVTVKADRDCYLRVYNVNPQGRATQLFPNLFQTDNFVKAAQSVVIPAGGAKFDLEIMGDSKADFGNEIINVIAAEKQFLDLVNVAPRDYANGVAGRYLNVTTRGLGQTTRPLTFAETFIQGARSVGVVAKPAVQVFDISAKSTGMVTRPGPGKK